MGKISDTQNLDRANTITGPGGVRTILGRYRLERILGQGGMGVVWLAYDEKLNREVALKFLPEIVVNDRASLNDLIRETRRSLELTHPNIVRTYDFVQDETVAGISMEYVDSDTLRNLRLDQQNGVFEPGQMGEWVKQLCSALHYAHTEASIVHRDLKPANLMINGRGQLKVADFGIARSLVESVSHMTLQGGTSGTLVYMSPQQLSGDTASPADDIYSVGATLYELFTTRPPFYSGDISGQVRTKVPPSVAQRRSSLSIPVLDFPSNWEETIAACLAKEPGDRPQSAAEIPVRLGLASAASISAASLAPLAVRTDASAASLPAPIASPGSYPTATGLIAPAPAPRTSPNRRNLLIGVGLAVAAILILAVLGVILISGRNEQARHEQAIKEQQEQARISAEHLANARGSLLIRTEPAGATVKLADLPAQKTPAAIPDLKLGKQTYQIEMDGYDPVTVTAQVEEGKVVQPDIVVLAPSKGALQIHSNPENLSFDLTSKANPLQAVHGLTPFVASALPVGEYTVTVTRDGWAPATQIVQVTRDHEENRMFEFPTGSVTLNSDPPGAKIAVKDRELGVTPLHLDGLPPGPVTYTLQAQGFGKTVVSGAVAPGQDLPLMASLKKTAVASTSRSHSTSGGRSSGGRSGGSDGNDHALQWAKTVIPALPYLPHP